MIKLSVPMLTTFFLIAIRTSPLLLFSPIQAFTALPVMVRLLLLMILSLFIAHNSPLAEPLVEHTALIIAGIIEFCNGLLLTLCLHAALAVFQIAGQLIDEQMGLNALAILNPADHSYDSITGKLLLLLATIIFFASNGHHHMLKTVMASFQAIPPGTLAMFNGFNAVIRQFGLMFYLGFLLTVPLFASLAVIELAGSILARSAPQLSAWFLTLPVKILFGFVALSIVLSSFKPFAAKVFSFCYQSWQRILS
ncbi:flagellar biosynthetic protein FliR [Legionella dresdenensis]|uniref:Flagellar biosynthetic protein FliR n=1 Tax=Legionella dresdenensis TaxID=450200 RepID=A0ABV8CHL8_9GAMM